MMIAMTGRFALLIACGGLAIASSSCGGSGDDAATTTGATPVPSASSTTPSTTVSTSTTTSTTTPPDTTVAPSTTVADPAIAELLLSGEGIGTAGFGAEPDGAIEYITSYLGAPSNDTGWIDPLTIGLCSGDEIRQVSWGVLTLLFGDVSEVLEGRRHFFGYTYGELDSIGSEPVGLQTTRGVQIGSRVVDVRAAYPAASINPEDDFGPPFFFVNDSLRGFLTGIEDDATVTAVLGGSDCGI
jgi:hypothetical protein